MPESSQTPTSRARISAYPGSVPLRLKWIYAIGASAEAIIGVAFNAFNFFFYTNLLGLPGTLAGLAITIALIFDAITDPLVGSISDRWKSRFGRRHPFMFMAPLPVMVCLFFIYSPPETVENLGLFLWLTSLTVLMRSSMTLFHVPHLAMGAELSSDFTERTRVMSYNTLFGMFGGVGIAWVGYSIFFGATAEYNNGLLNASAYPAFASTAALVGGAVMLLSTVFTLRLVPDLPQAPPDLDGFSMRSFFGDVRSAMSNRNYLFLLLGFLTLSAMLGTRDTIGLHMNTYFWELVPSQIRFFVLVGVVSPIVGFAAAPRLHERFDKKPTIIVSLLFLCTFSGMPVVLRIVGLAPENGSPLLFPMLLLIATLGAISGLILYISVMSTLADIADEQELRTHRRQEGIFYAARSFFAKATSGLGHLLAGIALDVIEFPAGADPGTVDPKTILSLGIVDGPIAVIPGFIAVGFYLQYKLTRQEHAEIQRKLEERHRGGQGSAGAAERPEEADESSLP